MDFQLILLAFAVIGASALQTATGIGFGVIAGPVLLMVLNSGAAIQISIGLSLLIAAMLVPSLWRNTDRQLLLRLLAGSAPGIPIGLAVFLSIDIDLLKLLAGFAVLFTLAFIFRAGSGAEHSKARRPGVLEQISLGVISGTMSGGLAMPGPVPAAWMAARSYGKDTIRATLLSLFIFSYLAALSLQAMLVGIAEEALHFSLILVAPTLAGVIIGRFLTQRLTERTFRWVLISVLTATTAGLFLSSIPNLVAQ